MNAKQLATWLVLASPFAVVGYGWHSFRHHDDPTGRVEIDAADALRRAETEPVAFLNEVKNSEILISGSVLKTATFGKQSAIVYLDGKPGTVPLYDVALDAAARVTPGQRVSATCRVMNVAESVFDLDDCKSLH